MLRVGAFMAALLVQVTGLPILCRLLAPWEPWPGHIVEYQQIPVADTKNCLHKTVLNMIVYQSALKKESRSYKNIKTNLETLRKNAERNQQKNMIKDVILYQRNMYLISDESTIQVLGAHLGPSELIFRGKNLLTKISSILKNEKLDVYKVRMNVFYSDKKKSKNKMEPLQLIYSENSCKYMGTRLPLVITLQTKTMLKAEEACFKKCQEDWKSILVLRLVKQQQSRGREHIVIQMLQKEKCKNNTDRILASAKERENYTNIMFLVVKQILHDKRKGQYTEHKKYGQLFVSCQQKSIFSVKEKIKVQKWKTNKKTVENQKFPCIHAFTHHRGRYSTWKILLTHNILSHIKKTQDSTIKRKTSRDKKWIKNQSTLFKVFIRESKTRKTEMGISSKLYYMQSSVINHNFLVITTARKIQGEALSSEINQMKSFVYIIEMLKHLMEPSQKANRYFSVAHTGFRKSALKAFVERKHLSTESFLNMLHLHKHIFQVPSVVKKTKRSTQEEDIHISSGSFNRATSALEACATVFSIVLLALFLVACYLFYKRRQLKQFLDHILKHGESSHRSESTYSKQGPRISHPQDANFGPSKESSKMQTTMERGSQTLPREQERRYNAESPISESCSREEEDTMNEVNARSTESTESLCDDDVWETSSAKESMENRCSNQPRSNTNRKENAPISVSYHSYKTRDHSPSGDKLLKLKKPRVSKSKSENDMHTSSSTELRAVRSFIILDGR